MAAYLRRLCGLVRPDLTPRIFLAGLLACLGAAAPAAAGEPPAAPVCDFPAPRLVPPAGPEPCNTPPVPVTPPKVAEAAALVEASRCDDGLIEVVVGQSRLVTVKEDLRTPKRSAEFIFADDKIAEAFDVPRDPKATPRPLIRIVGKKVGVTDLVINTPTDKTLKFQVRVIPDPERERALQAEMQFVNARLQSLFPDASLKLTPVHDKVVIVEGEARSTAQVRRILDTVNAYLGVPIYARGGAGSDLTVLAGGAGVVTEKDIHVINMLRVPGSNQVLLKVRVAELNRTAMREIGADFLVFDKSSPLAIGTSLGNSTISGSGVFSNGSFNVSAAGANVPGTTTTFGIFNRGDFETFISALRKNSLLKILAEPNLVALDGQRANFLAGGQFFIPTAQTSIGAVAGGVTATPVNFGVSLDFLAHILDGDLIRLTVDPAVSQPDFTVATTLVAGGSPVPGLNIRSAHTTVELHQGQTLAIAGLMQLTLDGTTTKIPGLGDLPILGPFFSNTTNSRTEKELVVLVTPYLVEPMNPDQVPPGPGDEVKEPNDLEFFLLGRIESRIGKDNRSTVEYDDAMHVVRCLLRLHEQNVRGPQGYSE